MQKARRHPSRGLRPLVSVRFQVLFHSLIQGTFHLSLTVLVRYRSHRSIQPYRMVPAVSRKVSRAPRYSGYYQNLYKLTCTGLSPSMITLSNVFQFIVQFILQSYNPKIAVTNLVWASSVSLAATQEITVVFFSSGYLDVSVLRVRPILMVLCLQHSGLPHSEIHGSMLMCSSPQLIAAYRVLLRLCEPRHPPYALNNFSRIFSTIVFPLSIC